MLVSHSQVDPDVHGHMAGGPDPGHAPAAMPPSADHRPTVQRADRIRILFVDHTAEMGGGEIAMMNLVRHLDPERYQPVVLLFAEGPLAEDLRRADVETHIVPLSKSLGGARKDTLGWRALLRLSDGFVALAFALRIRRFICAGGFDIIHTNSLKADILGGFAGRLAGSKVVWHLRDRIAEDYLPKASVRVMRLLARFIPHYVIANSVATLQTLLPNETRRGTAIPSGILLHSRHHPAVGLNSRSDQSLKVHATDHDTPTERRIGLVGRISPWKGQDIFLRAAACVHEHFPRVRFQVIGAALFGEQAYERQMQALSAELGLDAVVEFTGFRRDVAYLIDEMEVLVHASTLPEPFGQVIVQGMAAGKPVIATNGGGVPEIVQHEETGLLVPMGDVCALAEALLRLLRDPAWGKRMGQRGAERVQDHFTIEKTTARVQEVYDCMMSAAAT